MFDSNRSGGHGDSDLYVCFSAGGGEWSDPLNLGPAINTEGYDAIPTLSPDGRRLFFHRDGDIYWVDAAVLDKLKPR